MAMVMAVFEDPRAAEQALRALEAEGFEREDMDVRTGDALLHQRQPEQGQSNRAEQENGGVWGRIRHLFEEVRPSSKGKSSKGDSSKGTSQASAAGETASLADSDVVLIVSADDERTEQAADIMEESGAVDLDERLGGLAGVEAAEEDVPVYAMVIEEVAIETDLTAVSAAAPGQQDQQQAQPQGSQGESAGGKPRAGKSGEQERKGQ